MGKFNGGVLKGVPFKYTSMNIQISYKNDVDIIDSLNEFKIFLSGICTWLNKSLPSYSNSDLKNLIDEIMGHVNQTLFLFTLN